MDRKFLALVMVLVVSVGVANAGRHLTTKDEELGTPPPLPLPKQQEDIAPLQQPQPQSQPQPSAVPPPEEEEKEFTFYMHHSPEVANGQGGINGGGLGKGGGPLPLTFPVGALLNNPNNLANSLGLCGLGLGGGGALINGANGLGLGGVLGGGVLSNPNLVNNANSLGGLGGVGLTTPNFAGGLGFGQLGGTNGGALGGNQEYDHMVMLEEPITHEPYEKSPPIGKAQGYYMEMEPSHEHADDDHHHMLAMSFTASFHDGEYLGSLVQLAGQINMDDNDDDTKGNGSENVLQVVGGSGVFEKAIGHHALVHVIPSIHQEHGLLFKISIPLLA